MGGKEGKKSSKKSKHKSRDGDHHDTHKSHKHKTKNTVVLSDGTRIITKKKKKRLPDGGTLIQNRTESIAPLHDAEGQDGGDGDHTILTKTIKLLADGTEYTTLEKELVLASNVDVAPSEDDMPIVTTNTGESILTDGSRVIRTETQKDFPNGNSSTIVTTIRMLSQKPPPESISEQSKNLNNVSALTNSYLPGDISDRSGGTMLELDLSNNDAPVPLGQTASQYAGDDEMVREKMRAVAGNSQATRPNSDEHLKRSAMSGSPAVHVGAQRVQGAPPSNKKGGKSVPAVEYDEEQGLLDATMENAQKSGKGSNNGGRMLEMDLSDHAPMPFVARMDASEDVANQKVRGSFIPSREDPTSVPMGHDVNITAASMQVSEKNASYTHAAQHGSDMPKDYSQMTTSVSDASKSREERSVADRSKTYHSHKRGQDDTDDATEFLLAGEDASKTKRNDDSVYTPMERYHDDETFQSNIRGNAVEGFDAHGLAVAKPVDGDDFDPTGGRDIHAAIEYDPDAKIPIYKKKKCIIGTVLSLVAIAVIVSVSVVKGTSNYQEEVIEEVVITQSPTKSPSASPTTTRELVGVREVIEANVLQRNATFDEMSADDPRRQALNWILNEDALQLGVEDENLYQRYVLALLAFALESSEWKNCGDYSSGDSLCEVLDDDDFVSNATVVDADSGSEGDISVVWLSNTDECTWFGVTCVDGVVRKLELGYNNMIGVIPPEISILNSSEVISFNDNCLLGTLPPEMGNMKRLQILNLGYNGLSGLFPNELYELSSLVDLDVSANYDSWQKCNRTDGSVVDANYVMGDPNNDENKGLEGNFFGPQIEKLQNLERLTVYSNDFRGVMSPQIGNLTRLVEIHASENVITGSIPDTFTNLVNLREFWLENNRMTGNLPSGIGSMSSLEKISVWQNEMGGLIPDSLYDLLGLQVLFLHNTYYSGQLSYDHGFQGSIRTEIGNLKNLTHLFLQSNPITGTVPTEIGLLEKLEYIKIQHTQIQGTVPDEVCDLDLVGRKADDYDEVFVADCRSEDPEVEPRVICDCCDVCCDQFTGICVSE